MAAALLIQTCGFADCKYPVMQNGDEVHCRLHAYLTCPNGHPAVSRCEKCNLFTCAKEAHACPPPKPPRPQKRKDLEPDDPHSYWEGHYDSCRGVSPLPAGWYVYVDDGEDHRLLYLKHADTRTEAQEHANKIVEHCFGGRGDRVSGAVVLKLWPEARVDVAGIYKAADERAEAEDRAEAEATERELALKLLEKYPDLKRK